ncbi:MAG: hypothetical protein WCV99_18130 [Sterolibacterium sp.]
MITSDIVAKLWNACNILKDDGVTCHQYVTESTWQTVINEVHQGDRCG